MAACDVNGKILVVFWIRKGAFVRELASFFGFKGEWPSKCLPPSRTYAVARPNIEACIRSGLSTIVASPALDVRGLEYRCP